MADSACYVELASINGEFFTNSLVDDIMIRPQYATQKILIGTSNGLVPSLTVTSNNVGIGTTTPAYKLDVSGDINFSGTLRQNGTTFTSSQWSNNSTNVFLLGSNVGLETSAPTEKLQVSSGKIYCDTQILNSTNDTVTVPGFSFKENSNTGIFHAGTDTIGFSTGGNERLRIDSTGNVGVGTTSPSYKLDVNGAIRVANGILMNQNDDTYIGISATSSAPSLGLIKKYASLPCFAFTSNYGNSTSANAMNFGMLSGSNLAGVSACNLSTFMTLDNSGNLGIGITTPTAKLHVNGSSILNGGNAIVVQNTQDGGTSRGIYLWQLSDTNWGIYMGQSGATKSLSGGTAVTGYGFTSHAMRFRANGTTVNGFIFENNAEVCVASFRGDGLAYIAGNATIYNTSIGNAGHGAGFACFAHSNLFNTSSYGLVHASDGTTFINCAAGKPILFRENNLDKATITSGNFGIGTTTPSYVLHVSSNIAANGTVVAVDNPNTGTSGLSSFIARNSGSTSYGGMRMGMLGTGWTNSGHLLQNGGFLDCDQSNGISVAATSNSGSIRFYAGGTTEVMRVNSNQNVGIGTTTPTYMLDVQGGTVGITNTGAKKLQFPNDNTTNRHIVLYETANNEHQYLGFGINANTLRYQVDQTGANHIFYAAASSTASTELMRIQGTGNVGIGTSSPTAKLQVAGVISAQQAGEVRYHMYNMGGQAEWKFGQKSSSAHDFILSKVVSGAETDYMTINTSGNVGISTSTPAYKLDVQGIVGITNTGAKKLQLVNDTSTNRHIVLYEDTNNEHQYYGFGVNSATLRYQISGTGANHVFYAATSSSASTELMRIQGTGNVGIGTASPSTKLEVSGTIKATNYILPNSGWINSADTRGRLYFGTDARSYYGSFDGHEWRSSNDGTMMVLTNGGNLGIGTSTPGYLLHAASNITLAGAIIATEILNTTSYAGFAARNSGSTVSGGMRMGILGTGWTSGGIYQQNGGFLECDQSNGISIAASSNNGSIRFYAGGTTEVMRVNSNQNVGIGTTTPAYTLDVAGTINSSGNLTGPTITSLSNLGIFGSNTAIWSSNNMFNKAGGTITGSTSFYQGSPLILSNTSLAGSYPLVLQSSTGTNGITNGLAFMNTTATPSQAVPGGLILLERMGAAGRGMLHFATKNGTLNTDSCDIRMSITPDGKIGIGTSNPSATLSVNNNAGQGSTSVMTIENGTNANKVGMFVNLTGGNYNGCVATGDAAIISGLGTTDSGSLVLAVWGNSNAGIRIDKTGYVGVGTASPAYKLDVNGTVNATGYVGTNSFQITSNSGTARIGSSTAGGMYLSLNQGQNMWVPDSNWPNYGIGSSPTGTLGISGYYGITFGTRGIINMTIDGGGTGNVGIGTASPSARLHVNGGPLIVSQCNATGTVYIGSTSNNGAFISLGQNASMLNSASNWPLYGIGNSETGIVNIQGYYGVRIGDGTNNTIVVSGNNVGIGTTTPAYKLDVNGVIRVANGILMNQNDDTYIGISATNSAPALGLIKKYASLPCFAFTSNYGNSTSANAMYFGMLSGSNLGAVSACNLTIYMTLDNAGNFGIGTTPGYKLDVNGDIHAGNNGCLMSGTTSGFLRMVGVSSATYIQSGLANTNNSAAPLVFGTINNATEWARFDNTGNFGIGTTTPTAKLNVVGNSILDGGNQIGVQNGQDGGIGRGIYMYSLADTNWGIYMGQSGATKSLAGATAVAGYGFNSYATRIRVSNGATTGFILENISESLLMSVRGSDGLTYFAGNVTANNTYVGTYAGGTGYAQFSHATFSNSTTSYGLLQSTSGTLYLNCATGQAIRFRENNADVGIITGSKMGILTAAPSYQLHVVGTIYATGDIIGFSDKRLKSNITIIDSALSKIHKLNGYTFNLQDDEKPHTGLIAQEVLDVLPEAVHQEKKADGTDGYYSLAYGNMAGLFVEAIKEIDNKYKSQITELQETVSILKQEIDLLKNKI
jgi:Chaperone of endosialidase